MCASDDRVDFEGSLIFRIVERREELTI